MLEDVKKMSVVLMNFYFVLFLLFEMFTYVWVL